MKEVNLKELLAQIQDTTSQFENVNRGGCAVFAALVAKRLTKIGVPVVAKVSSYAFANHTAIDDTARLGKELTRSNLQESGLAFCHVSLEIPIDGTKHYFDSENLTLAIEAGQEEPTCGFVMTHGGLNPIQISNIARTKNWNYTFSRRQIPNMIKALNKVFASFA